MLLIGIILCVIWAVIALWKSKTNHQVISLILVVVMLFVLAILKDLPKDESLITETYVETIEMTDEYYSFDEDVKVTIHQSEKGSSYIEVYEGTFDTPKWAKIVLLDFTDEFDIYKVYHVN